MLFWFQPVNKKEQIMTNTGIYFLLAVSHQRTRYDSLSLKMIELCDGEIALRQVIKAHDILYILCFIPHILVYCTYSKVDFWLRYSNFHHCEQWVKILDHVAFCQWNILRLKSSNCSHVEIILNKFRSVLQILMKWCQHH